MSIDVNMFKKIKQWVKLVKAMYDDVASYIFKGF